MATSLRALIVEDSPDDATLLVRELERGGYAITFARVDTPEALTDALRQGAWDILFADYTMPRFSGAAALELVRSNQRELPFIFVSGTMGEDLAVEAMKAGANDYIIKGHLKRLVPAVERELRDAALRRERLRVEAERQAAEEALRVTEERHQLLFQRIADAILVLDREGAISFASASAREVLGYEPETLHGRPYLELIHPDDGGRAREALARVTRRPDAQETVEARMHHHDASWATMDCVLRNLLHHADIRGLVVTCRDITARKRLEAEFLQAQKLESIGRLAGGIAHDFNNLLTAVIGYADLVLMDPAEPTAHEADLEQIKRAAARGTALTRQLLAFSRRQVLDVRPLDLNQIVGNVMEMLRRLLGEEIEVRANLDPDLGTVRADPGQMEQVLLNLAVNARDAMPDGGQLTITTANVDAAADEIHAAAAAGRYVRLIVRDTGVGMDADTQSKIFEPFFTTKSAGEGTGLGLATVYGIVTQSGGHISADSEVGHGTTFTIYLSRVDEPSENVRALSETASAPRGTETVLVVEDEARVRNLITRILDGLGYTVLAAGHAEDAMPFLENRAQPINVLLTDVVLPDIGGKALAQRATSLRPGLRVLYMSGYATPVLAQRGVLEPGVALLHKPFTAVSLAARVRQVLDTRA